MNSKATSPDQYVSELPQDRIQPISKLRSSINKHRDPSLEETMGYGMLAYVVPLSQYPNGYHCNPNLPLPFMNLASQKNYISFYHMGLYNKDLENWFKEEYHKKVGKKPDMGKCCIRFKKMDNIPYELVGELAGKMSSEEWISYYERTLEK